MEQNAQVRLAICINNNGYIDDLKVRTVYQVLPDASAAKSHYVRIIDETGEDYLYPAAYFVFIDVPQDVERTLTDSTSSKKLRPKKNRKRTTTNKTPKTLV